MNCKSCKFWWPYKGGVVSPKQEERRDIAKKGECRRYPPCDPSDVVGRFSHTRPEQWCGEYKS